MNKNDKFSFVLYQKNSSPRCFEIPRKIVYFLTYTIPFITLISILFVIFGLVYLEDISQFIKKAPIPLEKKYDPIKEQRLVKENKILQESIKKLQEKVTKVPLSKSLIATSLFHPVANQKDLTNIPSLKIEKVKYRKKTRSFELDFHFKNITKNGNKIAGFFFILLKYNSQIIFWPTHSLSNSEILIDYNKGEIFTTSRFRLVHASFPIEIKNQKNLQFKIIVFNKVGDIILNTLIQQEKS